MHHSDVIGLVTELKNISESVRGRTDPGMGGPPHSGGHPVGSPAYSLGIDEPSWRSRSRTMRPGQREPHVGFSNPSGRKYSQKADWEKRGVNRAERRRSKDLARSELHDYQTPPSRGPLHLIGGVSEQRSFRILERQDLIPGGKADYSDESEFDPVQLRLGIEVEREHTKSDAIAKEIAMDHLKEDPRYYSKLRLIHKD